jgi:hypothetical protein
LVWARRKWFAGALRPVKFQKLLPADGIIAADLVLPPDLG